jgi:hypothetical protein
MQSLLGRVATLGGILLLAVALYSVPSHLQGRALCAALLLVTVAIGAVIFRGSR